MSLQKHLPFLKKSLYILAGIVCTLLLLMLVAPLFFKDKINSSIKEIINSNITGTIDYQDIDVSFFRHFPSLSASIQNVHLRGAVPYETETLVKAKEISIGINLISLFRTQMILDKFLVSDADVQVLVDSLGRANYNIYSSTPDSNKSKKDEPQGQIALKLIKLDNVNLTYKDASIPMVISATNFNYVGRGNLSEDIFDLKTNAKIGAFNFILDNEKYVSNKSIDAQLITRINTNDLSFIFEKNDIKINKLPVRFKGSFAFLSNGYHLDFKLKSQESTLSELLSLIPESYAGWLKDTKIKGTSEVFMNLEGDYIVEQHKMPDLSLGLIINNGYLAYNNSKIPLSNWNTKFRVDLPQLNLDSLAINLKQFKFKVADGFFRTSGQVRGFDPLTIHSTVNSSLDLGSLNKAIRWPDFDFAGKMDLEGKVDGTYSTDTVTYGIRNKKKVIVSSIPTFNIKNTLKDGYLKLAGLPAAVDRIAYVLEAVGTDGKMKNASIALKDIDIKALNNYIKGYADIKNFENFLMDANIQADIDLADIKKVYPIDSVDISGNVFTNIIAQGHVDLAKNIVPETNATITMKNGYFKSWDYPIPLEQINVETYISSKSGSLKDLHIKILPISFHLAGEPFFLHADLDNFNNIKYAIKSKGKLNLEPLYKMFAVDGVNINGYVRTDLDLAGLQSDALKGKYNRLKNEGSLQIGNIQVETELLPKPIQIKSGDFSFKQEKLNFDRFISTYGNNQITIRGFIDNLINYLTSNTDVLKGHFNLHSPSLRVDDFMAFSTSDTSGTNTSSSGIILLPHNLDVQVVGKVDNVFYDQVQLRNFKGNLKLKGGKLDINDTGFEISSLRTKMEIKYQPLTPVKAKFEFKVEADSFDIQRAYVDIPLFQQMVTSAKNAHGIVSLNYQLGGLLNEEMMPIMPSIQGQGTLSLDKIRFRNFKLLNGISQKTSKEGFLDSDVKKVNIKTSIKNNVMTIERTKMKMAGFRPRFEGQVTLDGQMNIGFRLGLPPFGILGIPMRIRGTADNFNIKLGRYKEDDLDTDMDEEDKNLYESSLLQDSTATK